jgi:predicted nucleic acid binding AN1-type Zn finger protein
MICFSSDCQKKLTFIEKQVCKCNNCNHFYCTSHRLAELHKCSYNFKERNEEEIRKYIENNKCVGEKMVKI